MVRPLKLQDWQAVMADHARALDRLTGAAQMRRLKRLYDATVSDLERKLAAALHTAIAAPGDTMTALQYRVLLAQARAGVGAMARRIAGEAGDISRQAAHEAVRGLARTMTRLESKFAGAPVTLPIEQSARFWGIVDERATSAMRLHETSMARYGTALVGDMEEGLGLSLATGESGIDAVDRIVGIADDNEWQAERIVRTETAWAFSGSTADGIEEAVIDLPDLMMRWDEHVSPGGVPYDDRVSVDSLAMHGQVARPGGMFTCPPFAPDGTPVPGEGKPWGLAGKQFSFPPNRPQDRACVQPWRPHWGIPGWVWDGSQRVPMGKVT